MKVQLNEFKLPGFKREHGRGKCVSLSSTMRRYLGLHQYITQMLELQPLSTVTCRGLVLFFFFFLLYFVLNYCKIIIVSKHAMEHAYITTPSKIAVGSQRVQTRGREGLFSRFHQLSESKRRKIDLLAGNHITYGLALNRDLTHITSCDKHFQ